LLVLCWNNIKDDVIDDPRRLIGTIVHELTHALQFCHYDNPIREWGFRNEAERTSNACVRALIFEIEAYYCGGKARGDGCADFQECMLLALASACSGHCTPDDINAFTWRALRIYFERWRDEWCTFPRTPFFGEF
jgi:hypothetical protein